MQTSKKYKYYQQKKNINKKTKISLFIHKLNN